MRIYTPDECTSMYDTATEGYGSVHNITVFKFSDYWLPSRIDVLNRAYSHNINNVVESLDLITWPNMEEVLEYLEVYLLRDPSHDHFNGSAGAHLRDDKIKGHITLYGRSTPVPRFMSHYIFCHEMGHVIQDTYCRNLDQIKMYAELRNADYKRNEEWTKDWKQLWAEDWRWLFCTDTAHQDTWSMEYEKPDNRTKEFMLDSYRQTKRL